MSLTTRSSAPDAAGHQHVVEFYDTEAFLVGTVAGFVGPALNDGDAAVVVATAEHRAAFEAGLLASGVDLAGALATDRYSAMDAGELLGCFMAGGAPDPERFAELARGMIDRAGAGGRRVRIYGEMVALLWSAGDVASAIALEDLWNDLARERGFMLLCAYPMSGFESSASGAAFRRICEQHTTVIPTEDYAMLGGADAQQRAVAQLQQRIAALRADIARLRADQITAELEYIESPAARRGLPEVTSGSQLRRRRVPHGVPVTSAATSPGERLLIESLTTLSGRLRYAD